MSIAQRLIKSTMAYTAVGLLGPAVALVLTPLYTRALGVAGYGTVDLLQTLAHIVYTVALWGIPTTLASRYYADQDDARQRQLVASALSVAIGVSLIVAVLATLAAPSLAWFSQRPEITHLVIIQMMALPFGVLYGAVLALLRLRSDTTRVLWMSVILVVVTAASRLTLVVWGQWGVSGMIVAAALTNVVNAVVIVVIAWPWIHGRIVYQDVRDVVRLGAPLVPASIAVWLLLYQDRWVLAGYVDAVTQGEYALAVLLTSLLALVIEPFKQAWMPLAIQQATHVRALFLETSLRVYVWGALGCGMIVLAATPELLWIMSGHTSAGMPLLVALLSMLPMSGGVVTIVGLMVTMHARPSITGWSTLVAAIVNMLLNIWLIPQYGVYGAAVATAIAAWCIPVLVWRGSQTLEVVQYAWGRIGIAVAWYGVVCAWVIIQAEHVWLRAIGVVVFVVGLLFSRLVTLREVRAWWHDQH